jgi:hypothetical protein
MKKLKVLLSNFSDDDNLSDSVIVIYNEYKKNKKKDNFSFELFEDMNNEKKFSDENLKNDLSQEEIKIINNNKKVLNILDNITDSYLKLYSILENNNKVLTDILQNIEVDDISISVKKIKMVEIIKSIMTTILVVLNSKYENENLFSIFQNKHQIKKGYDLLYCKKGKNIPIYYVHSYRLRFGDQGLGKMVPYDKNLEFKNEFYIGAKFMESTNINEIKCELKKTLKRLNKLQDYFNTQYTIAGAIYNNLRIFSD